MIHRRVPVFVAVLCALSLSIAGQAAAQALPSGWAATDIGAVGAAGNSSESGGTFTTAGGGADIWGTADAFRFTYTTMTGDGSIVARVASVENVAAWTKAGVEMRATLTAGSQHGMMLVSPGKGTAYQRRATSNGTSTNTAGPTTTAPYWVKLTRVANVVTAYASVDGATWTKVASQTITMPSTIYVGLGIGSHVQGQLATAVFDNVTVTGSAPPPPTSSTVVFFRHGEKPSGGYGQITCQGLNRALALPPVLQGKYGTPQYLFAPDPGKEEVVDQAGSFDYVRPLATIEPTAIRLGMPVNASYGLSEIGPLQTQLINLATANSVTVFVSWEHLKLKELMQNIMNSYGGGTTVPAWGSTDYDSLYVVHISTAGGTTTASFEHDYEGLNGLSTSCP